MERNREARRLNMATTNGLSRRRQRSNNLRDSPEEGGQTELQETVRLRERERERANKRDRDRDLSNRSKRRRGRNREEEGEESTEDSFGDEEEYEAEDGGGGGGGGGPSSSSSFFNQNHRKTLPPARGMRQTPPLKVSDEMIGVPVPRKARSACVKRSHENWASGNGGFGEDQNHRRASTSLIKKKTKPNGPKTRLPKVSKYSNSVQEDIEIEIAEVLFGLSKKEENIDNSSQKLESEDTYDQTSILPLKNSSVHFPAPKKKKVEAENSLISVLDSAIGFTVEVESEQPAKMDSSSPKLVKISGFNVESNDASIVAVSMESHEGAIKQRDSKPSVEELGLRDEAATKEKSISSKEESASKLDIDSQDSTVTKAIANVSEVKPQREEKFKIDLMAPPPTASFSEREGLIDLASDPRPLAHNVGMKMETFSKDEVKVADFKLKIETVKEKRGSPKHDFEKLNQDSDSVNGSRLQQHGQKQQQLPKANIHKLEKTAQSSSVSLPIAVAGWPSSLTPLGRYMPTFQTIMPMDGNNGSSAALQPPQIFLSQPRQKRCTTHHHIAHNIYLHQQFTKMNHFWPAATSSASLAKHGNPNVMPSTENMILGNPLQGNFPVFNLNSAQEKAQSITNFPGLAKKDKGSEATNFMDTAQRKQLMLQQAPQPAPAGNLPHGPAFIFPLSQQQAAVAGPTNKSGPSKSVTSTNNASLSSNSAARVPATSTAMPAVAATVSFNYPNLATNDAPYLTILPNTGYPFPISTPVGTPTQALPMINGSFYSSQMFHPQLLQQQPHSQPLVQPAHQNTSTSSGSSSSHKQLQTQQPRGAQVSGNNYLTSASMQLQQPQQPQQQHLPPSHQSRKLEAEISGENTPSVANNRASHTQRSAYGQNYTMPLQPLNYALMPPTTMSGGGNQGEKQQQQSQQKSFKGGVEFIPSQAFAMSFAPFNGFNTASNLNFSSMAQNPAIFQSFPDMPRQGYQVASAPQAQATQPKNHHLSKGKTGGSSTNPDDVKKTLLGKSSASNGQTLVFDNSTRTLNFVSSPSNGNWPSHSITSTTVTTYSPSANNSNNSQPHQLLQRHPSGAASSKAPTTNNLPSPSIATKFSNNFPVSPRSLIQCNSSA